MWLGEVPTSMGKNQIFLYYENVKSIQRSVFFETQKSTPFPLVHPLFLSHSQTIE